MATPQDPEIREGSLDQMGASIPWLRRRLESDGLKLHPKSELGTALTLLADIREQARVGTIARYPSPEHAQALHLRTSAAEFLTKALDRGFAAGLGGFEGHLKVLCSGDPLMTGPSGKSTTSRNKTWELLLACLTATFAQNVRLGEPDIRLQFNGQSIGVAGKVVYSSDPAQQLSVLVKGATQVENSDADVGFVAVNLVEQFPHGRMFRNFVEASVSDPAQARHVLDQWMWTFTSQYDIEQLGRRLRAKNKLLSIVFFLPTLIHLHGRDMPLVPYYRIHTLSIDGRQEKARPFEFALNTACQDVLSYQAPPIGVVAP